MTRRTPGHPAEQPALQRAQQFADPFTRRLLTHRGSTTALLEHHLGAPLALRLVAQRVRRTGMAAAHLLPLLGPHADEPWLVRRTELRHHSHAAVSRNLVMGPLPRRADLCTILTSDTVPLGRALAEHRLPQRRRLLRVGRSPWRPLATSAAWRGYVVHVDDELPFYVEEFFHPAIAPARLRPAPQPEPAPAAAS
ncbi:hypothetical protein AB0I84_41580 [Streptomyces spectabilis]|uniref:hypothetical protein n=1 Tax=Streptomyces spectabilis TaxID=68270 RepID=UPI0033F6A80A